MRSSRKKVDKVEEDIYEPASKVKVKSTYRAAHVIDQEEYYSPSYKTDRSRQTQTYAARRQSHFDPNQ